MTNIKIQKLLTQLANDEEMLSLLKRSYKSTEFLPAGGGTLNEKFEEELNELAEEIVYSTSNGYGLLHCNLGFEFMDILNIVYKFYFIEKRESKECAQEMESIIRRVKLQRSLLTFLEEITKDGKVRRTCIRHMAIKIGFFELAKNELSKRGFNSTYDMETYDLYKAVRKPAEKEFVDSFEKSFK